MRQVFLDNSIPTIKQVPEPTLNDYSVLVLVYYSCISSGTEAATITHSQKSLITHVPETFKKVLDSLLQDGIAATGTRVKSKLLADIQPLGYAVSGRVIAIGDNVRTLRVGDMVACAGAGLAYHADVICVPEHLVARINDERCIKGASLTTLGAIALQGIRRAQLQLGEHVAIIGLGLLGQLTIQLSKLSGCHVTALDMLPDRLECARLLGAEHVYDAQQENVLSAINYLTQHHGVDTTIITAASPSHTILQQAIAITRKKGKIVIVGDIGLHLEREPFYQKELDLLMSCSYGPGRYDRAYEHEGIDYPYPYVRWTEQRNMQEFVKLLEQRSITVDTLITHEYPITHIKEAYDQVRSKKSIAVILTYRESNEPLSSQALTRETSTPLIFIKPSEKVRVGLIGAGGFAQSVLLPLLAQNNTVTLTALVDTDNTNALKVSRLYTIKHLFTDYHELLDHDSIDAVVIATPHVYHAQQALAFLEQGKAVFLEKPLVTTFTELESVQKFLRNNPHAPLCVDFNRSAAPYIQKIKAIICQRNAPCMLQYRINAGFVPQDHWTQRAEGGGRIIGEACHIIDLFCYIIQAQPTRVSVECLRAQRGDLVSTDNFSAHISFNDGSLCTLIYTAIGHIGLGKEYMEVFCDGQSIIMNDYKALTSYGTSPTLNELSRTPNKGHKHLLELFFKELSKPVFTPPIAFDRLYTVAYLTLIIDHLARQGGGHVSLQANPHDNFNNHSSRY